MEVSVRSSGDRYEVAEVRSAPWDLVEMTQDEVPSDKAPELDLISRIFDHFPMLVLSLFPACFLFFIDWTGYRGVGRLGIEHRFADIWWHFFVYWGISWMVFVAVDWTLDWLTERLSR